MPLSFNFGDENQPELFQGKPKTPVTLLSGFLGSGKTTLLKHLLENQEGVRIGVVVNDVAAVNIDSQLVRRFEKGLVEVTELQNGCVCCSSADDLFTAVQNLVMQSKDNPFEHIVVELSGVGEPEAVKKNWAIGLECTMPVALRTEIKQVVTVVDASAFGRDWLDARQAQDRNEEVLGEKHDETNAKRFESVGQLLAEQVEWANVIVINKTDLASADDLGTTLEVVRALNGKARICQSEFGRVEPHVVLPTVPRGLRTAGSGAGAGFTWSQTSSELSVRMPIGELVKSRDIDLKVGKKSLKLGLKGALAPVIDCSLPQELANVGDAMFEIETSGSNNRCVVLTLEKRKAAMWPDLFQLPSDAGHCHRHEQCPGDGGHCHAASHRDSVQPQHNRAEARFGILSFTFCRRRPFNSQRLKRLFEAWPLPKKDMFCLQDLDCDEAEVLEFHEEPAIASPNDPRLCIQSSDLQPILRSKGFCWIDSEPSKQHEWSHAGKTLSVTPTSWWWSAMDPKQVEFKLTYPGEEATFREVKSAKWDQQVGDRRQELVFIGGPQMREASIVRLLEACLLDDEEYSDFLERTKLLKVPDDDFSVTGLLRRLGASEPELRDVERTKKDDGQRPQLQKMDHEETDFLRSLGVGCNLEEEDDHHFESID